MLAVGLTPPVGTEEDFDAWYRKEHLRDLAACPGYVRSRRFKTVRPHSDADAPYYISFHEYEGEELPMKEIMATTESEWSKKPCSAVKACLPILARWS